jgi:hypothetical protein
MYNDYQIMNGNAIIILLEIALVIITTIILGMHALAILHIMNKPHPDKIKNFCQAQFELYNKSLDVCIDSYKNKTQ